MIQHFNLIVTVAWNSFDRNSSQVFLLSLAVTLRMKQTNVLYLPTDKEGSYKESHVKWDIIWWNNVAYSIPTKLPGQRIKKEEGRTKKNKNILISMLMTQFAAVNVIYKQPVKNTNGIIIHTALSLVQKHESLIVICRSFGHFNRSVCVSQHLF